MSGFRLIWVVLLGLMILSGNTFATQAKSEKLKVIFFLDPECPISNAYMKEIKSIYADYAAKGVTFEAVFPMSTITDQAIRAFLKKYNTTIPGHSDANLQRAKRYQATVMPEVVLVNSAGMIVYKGAIDDWYYGLGKSRAKATEFYLRNAIDATLDGNPVLKSRTEAYGCLINM
ncbi:MAG: redoxin family protein [Dyadobacter sp.]|uniref:redoxin family protein n=1 Tax=Dyadobacter sp. TaxID=1914288 RepID=UPI003263C5FE